MRYCSPENMQISMFMLDSKLVDAVASHIAQLVRHAFVVDSDAAALPCSMHTSQEACATMYPFCILLKPGPALDQTMDAISPILTSHNELRAVAERLEIHEGLPLPENLRIHVISASIIRSEGTLDLVAGLCNGAPSATLPHILPSLAACLPFCPPITHLRVPPGTFDSPMILDPILPFLTPITRLTVSSPADTTTLLSQGYLHSFPSMVSIACQPCRIPDAPLPASPRSPTSSDSTSTAALSPDPTPAFAASQDSPIRASCAMTPTGHHLAAPGGRSAQESRPVQNLVELDITVPSLAEQLPLATPNLTHLSKLTACIVPTGDSAGSHSVQPPHQDPSATQGAQHPHTTPPVHPSPSILQLLPLCSHLRDLRLTLPSSGTLTQRAAAEQAQHAFRAAAHVAPQTLQRLELLAPGCPADAVVGLSRLTALRHLGVHACHECIGLLPALPHLASLKLFVPPESRGSEAALDARLACAAIARAALKRGGLSTFHVSTCAQLRTSDWRTEVTAAPPQLPCDLMHDLVHALRVLRLTGAADHACADAVFAAVDGRRGADPSTQHGPQHTCADGVGGAWGGDCGDAAGLEWLQVPLAAFSRIVCSGAMCEGEPVADCCVSVYGGAGLRGSPLAAVEPAARFRGLKELEVRRYGGHNGGRYTPDALRAVAALPALRSLVLGGVEGVCAALRPLRALRALSALSLPDAVATAADACGLAAAAAALPALRELFVEIDLPPALWEHALVGFKPRSRDQGSAYAEAEAAVEAAVGELREQCWGGLRRLQAGPRPLRRLELVASATASDDFVMWLLSSGVGYSARM